MPNTSIHYQQKVAEKYNKVSTIQKSCVHLHNPKKLYMQNCNEFAFCFIWNTNVNASALITAEISLSCLMHIDIAAS